MKTIDFIIDKKEVLRYAGHKGETVTRYIDQLAESVILQCKSVVTPRSVVRRCGILQQENGVKITGTNLIMYGEDIKKHLEGCDECYVMCVTAGVGADALIRTMMAVDTAHGLLADGAATAAVESCCDNIEAQLRKELEKENKSYLITSQTHSSAQHYKHLGTFFAKRSHKFYRLNSHSQNESITTVG